MDLKLNKWLNIIQTKLYPGQCLLCSSLTKQSLDLCEHCASTLPWLGTHCRLCALPMPPTAGTVCGGCVRDPPPFARTTALFTYRAPINHLISQLKFGRQLLPARLFGHLLARKLQSMTPRPDILLPVPLHRRRVTERGFNQARELCRWISHHTGIPIETRAIARSQATAPQSQLSLTQRRMNIRGAFELRRDINHAHVALVDDVMTSGNTLRELASMARRGGAVQVELLCIARAEMNPP